MAHLFSRLGNSSSYNLKINSSAAIIILLLMSITPVAAQAPYAGSPEDSPLNTGTPLNPVKYKIFFRHVNEEESGNPFVIRDRAPGSLSTIVDGSEQNLYDLQCIQKIFCDCYITGRDASGKCVPGTNYSTIYSRDGNPLAQGYEYLADECVIIKLGDLRSPGYCGILQQKHMDTIRDKQRCKRFGSNADNTHNCHMENILTGACKNNAATSMVVIDEQCHSLPSVPAADITASFDAWSAFTPISLVWDNQDTSKTTLVSFPLDPNKPKQFYTWRASSNMPLLVYDPDHKGRVTNATQLFGNWTWGGKAVASLDSTSIYPAAWSNGFEALSKLDTNDNGKIDGGELNQISLWFDANQDGKSQKGEVVPSVSKGVTALYYKTDSIQNNSKEIVASVGFEREIGTENNKEVIVGKAIDWLADQAQTKFELALQQQLISLSTNEELSSEPTEQNSADAISSYASLASNDKFAGTWKWSIKSDNAEVKKLVTVGTLMIVTNPNQAAVTGLSVIEVPVVGDNGTHFKIIANSPIKGNFKDSNGEQALEFTVMNGSKVVASSIAKISANGGLTGTTTSRTKTGAKGLSYEWEAKRI